MILVIQLPCFIFFPVDRHFVFFLTLKCVAKFQWTSLYGGLPWPVISLSAVSLYLWSMMVQKLLSGKVQKWAIYVCFYLLSILMKSLAVLLHPSQDMTHPSVQRVSPIRHFADIFVVRSAMWRPSTCVQVAVMGPKCKSRDAEKTPRVKSSAWPLMSGVRWESWNIPAESKWGRSMRVRQHTCFSLYVMLREVGCWLACMRLFSHTGPLITWVCVCLFLRRWIPWGCGLASLYCPLLAQNVEVSEQTHGWRKCSLAFPS